MPLFGPNIEKMKETRDVDGLWSATRSDSLQTRVKATEALIEIEDARGLQLISQRYSDVFKFGDNADKVEVMIMMQGRYLRMDTLVAWVVPLVGSTGDRPLEIMALEKVRFRTKPKLELARPILLEAATNSTENPLIRLLAGATLAELGDRSDELIQLMFSLLEEVEELNFWTIREILRALSHFSNNCEATDFLIRVQKGEVFRRESSEGIRQAALYGLGAIGSDLAREYLEYLTTSSSRVHKKEAQVALELFGKASYDEVRRKAEGDR